MSEQLKPAPCVHCGSTQIIEGSCGDHFMFLECMLCGATGPTDISRAKTIAAWNRHTPASEPAVDRDIAAAENYAAYYGDDERDHIKTDVVNAFYAGMKYARRATPAAPAVPEPVPMVASDKDRVMEALTEARSMAMRNTLAARIPECGNFGAIAQNLDWAITEMESADLRQTQVESNSPEFDGIGVQGAQASPVLDDADIETVWLTMPGGPAGWLKSFGYLDFAQAIEDLVLERLSELATGTDTSQGDA